VLRQCLSPFVLPEPGRGYLGTTLGATFGRNQRRYGVVSVLPLLGIGFAAGVITAVSPCVLPVLPIALAGGATGSSNRRPLAIVAGVVASFTTFTLIAATLLSALGLPEDLLRNLAIALLFVLAATLLFPRLAILLERPLAFMTRRRGRELGGGFLLGVSLGLVFVPCAGPVLATISVLAAQKRISTDTVLLTLAYALGAAVPLLLVALGGQRVARRFRAGSQAFRFSMGLLLAAAAFAIVFNLDQGLQTHLGGYTNALQKHVELTGSARSRLATLRGTTLRPAAHETAGTLPNYGPAPEFKGISHWLNTPGDKPLTLASLRGKVVLVDFWTYSCINCLRTIPHLRALYTAYHPRGLEIVGVHTPEFAFEHELGNVRTAVRNLDVTWPVALDNSYDTWNAYSNEYWPAEYLLDRDGRLRRAHFGEGEYSATERAIRRLLDAPASVHARAVPDTTPTAPATPESYLGYARLDQSRYAGSPLAPDAAHDYTLPARLAQNALGFGGFWTIGHERAIAGLNARLALHFVARVVYLVLGGGGSVQVLVDGMRTRTVRVNGDRLYTLVNGTKQLDTTLELRFTPGVSAYAFTFG
jgi:cytochrome c biogenesis protein CcdA/thiol-disulfide isomerase/thioredoxin